MPNQTKSKPQATVRGSEGKSGGKKADEETENASGVNPAGQLFMHPGWRGDVGKRH